MQRCRHWTRGRPPEPLSCCQGIRGCPPELPCYQHQARGRPPKLFCHSRRPLGQPPKLSHCRCWTRGMPPEGSHPHRHRFGGPPELFCRHHGNHGLWNCYAASSRACYLRRWQSSSQRRIILRQTCKVPPLMSVREQHCCCGCPAELRVFVSPGDRSGERRQEGNSRS